MKIVIWGSFRYGNFGDDVMALMIGMRLKSAGDNQIFVVGMSSELCSRYGFGVIDKLYEEERFCPVVENCDLLLIGGGAVFSRYTMRDEIERAYDREIGELVDVAERFNTPIWAISIGSGGQADLEGLSRNQLRLVECRLFVKAWVRLMSDVKLLAKPFRSVAHIPDIVLYANLYADHFSPVRDDCGVLINLPSRNYDRFFRIALDFCCLIGIRNVTLSAYLDGAFPEGASLEFRHPTRRLTFNDPLWLVRYFGGSKPILVSNKLHLGVSVLSCGGLFISVLGKPKTVAFIDELRKGGFVRAFGFRFFRIVWGLRLPPSGFVESEEFLSELCHLREGRFTNR